VQLTDALYIAFGKILTISGRTIKDEAQFDPQLSKDALAAVQSILDKVRAPAGGSGCFVAWRWQWWGHCRQADCGAAGGCSGGGAGGWRRGEVVWSTRRRAHSGAMVRECMQPPQAPQLPLITAA
jgi:hypothetical protein